MKIYLIHRHKKGIISFLIRLITRSWSSHTALLIDGFVYESDKGLVRKMNYIFWCSDSEVLIQKIDLTIENKNKLTNILENQLGKGYDFKSTIIDQLIFQLYGKWTGHTGNYAINKFYCSEFIAYCLNEVTGNYPNWWKISPKDLFNEERYNSIYKGIDKQFN